MALKGPFQPQTFCDSINPELWPVCTLSTQNLFNLQPPAQVYSSQLCSEIARAILLNSYLFNSIVVAADFSTGGKKKRGHSPVLQALIDFVRWKFQVLIKEKKSTPSASFGGQYNLFPTSFNCKQDIQEHNFHGIAYNDRTRSLNEWSFYLQGCKQLEWECVPS